MPCRSSPLPRMGGISWMPTPASSPLGGEAWCVFYRLPDIPPRTKLQFPAVCPTWLGDTPFLDSFPSLCLFLSLMIPGITSPINYSWILVSGLLLGKPKRRHQVTGIGHNPRGIRTQATSSMFTTRVRDCQCHGSNRRAALQALDLYFRQEKGENIKSQQQPKPPPPEVLPF